MFLNYAGAGNVLGPSAGFGGFTFDRAAYDSGGAFFVGQLERLDQTLHEPLVNITYMRDIDLREDVTIGDDVSSFTQSTYAAPGGTSSGGKSWASKEGNAITGISLDIGKVANPLTPWAMEVKYTQWELESAKQAGRPIDTQKYAGMLLKHQMDTDAMVYVGDTELGYTGLFNAPALDANGKPFVAQGSVVPGASGSTKWATKTPDEILNDINTLTVTAWVNSGLAIFPSEVRLPPAEMAYIANAKVSLAGNVSILQYVMANSLCNQHNGRPLNIHAVKWLTGAGVGGSDRMVAYTRDINKVRFPMTLVQRTPIEYRSVWVSSTYFNKLGVVEFVYPEVVAYGDGIG
jgi:hypothetical protein